MILTASAALSATIASKSTQQPPHPPLLADEHVLPKVWRVLVNQFRQLVLHVELDELGHHIIPTT